MVKPLAYIDTGAQICVFDKSYAKQLGIKIYRDVKSSEDIDKITFKHHLYHSSIQGFNYRY
ncbi:MAG: hypothetical protein J7J25_02205 [Candidatus Omnitrophica bacterium]|nr:hypothetical protein [Candidatus Omnitrophota bacterium]